MKWMGKNTLTNVLGTILALSLVSALSEILAPVKAFEKKPTHHFTISDVRILQPSISKKLENNGVTPWITIHTDVHQDSIWWLWVNPNALPCTHPSWKEFEAQTPKPTGSDYFQPGGVKVSGDERRIE